MNRVIFGNDRMDRGGVFKQAGFKQSWSMLVKRSKRRLIPKQKSRLIALRTRAIQPPLSFFLLLPTFCSNFFFYSNHLINILTRQCLVQSQSSLRPRPSPSRISSKSPLTKASLLALATQYVSFPECRVAFLLRSSSRLNLYQN